MKTWNDISMAQRILFTEWYLGRPLRDAEKLFMQTIDMAEREGRAVVALKTRHKPEPLFNQEKLRARIAQLDFKVPDEDRESYWIGIDPVGPTDFDGNITKASDGIVSMLRQQKIVPYEKARQPVAQYFVRPDNFNQELLKEMQDYAANYEARFQEETEKAYWHGSPPSSNYVPPKRTKWQRLYIKVVALVALRQRITDLKTAGQYILLAFGVGKRPELPYNED